MQPSRLVAAVKFLSCQVFFPPLLPSFRQTHSFTASPLCELQVGWMFHEFHPQPFRCSELLWTLAGHRSLSIFCFNFAPNMPTNLVSNISWFQSPLCGFAAEPTYSSEPADLLCLLQHPPSSSSIPLSHSTEPLDRFWGADKAPTCPQAHGREDVTSCASQTPVSHWLLSKITPLNKKYYQQEHNQIPETRPSDE